VSPAKAIAGLSHESTLTNMALPLLGWYGNMNIGRDLVQIKEAEERTGHA
jgi:hypothetical protein